MDRQAWAAGVGKGRARGRIAAPLAVTAVLLAGCSSPQPGGAGWTAQAGPSTAAPAGGTDGAVPSSGAPASSTPPAAASQAATAATWKTFSDPSRTVSFDLPQDWVAQSVQPDAGTLPGALKIDVKKPDGTFMAALRTGLPPSSADCPDGSRRPYTVISSVPADMAAGQVAGTIPPRVVFRVIQGYRFFGSYGLTDVVGGADNQACVLRNILRGPEGKGDVSFGDVVDLRAFAPDEKVAPAKAFHTLGDAAAYAGDGADFANVQRMLMSLEIKN
ncbi:hypothetical protein [Pseudarthrobacter enclensis]|uniref:hypothetical protein n=1 Tax=Pseudarthrobacter enclensis TaxID=993070 RepID=UPI003EDF4355